MALVGLLGLETGLGEVAVQQAGGDRVRGQGAHGRGPDPVFASVRVVGGVQDRAGGELGLVDRRDRLGVVGQAGQHPGELGGVDGGHLHHGDVHVALVVQQFAAQRLVETLDGVFGAAVRGLQRDAAVGQRGADLHDRAPVAGLHVLQGGHGAVDVAEVADLGHAPVLRRGDLVERGEHGGERDVDPHVDRADVGLDALGGREHLVRVGHVGGDDVRGAAGLLDLRGRTGEALRAPRDEHHGVPAGRQTRLRWPGRYRRWNR